MTMTQPPTAILPSTPRPKNFFISKKDLKMKMLFVGAGLTIIVAGLQAPG